MRSSANLLPSCIDHQTSPRTQVCARFVPSIPAVSRQRCWRHPFLAVTPRLRLLSCPAQRAAPVSRCGRGQDVDDDPRREIGICVYMSSSRILTWQSLHWGGGEAFQEGTRLVAGRPSSRFFPFPPPPPQRVRKAKKETKKTKRFRHADPARHSTFELTTPLACRTLALEAIRKACTCDGGAKPWPHSALLTVPE